MAAAGGRGAEAAGGAPGAALETVQAGSPGLDEAALLELWFRYSLLSLQLYFLFLNYGYTHSPPHTSPINTTTHTHRHRFGRITLYNYDMLLLALIY